MLAVNALAPSQGAADECGGSGDQVFDRDQVERARFSVQRGSPRQRAPERAKQVDADRARFVDQLQQRPAVDGPLVDVVLEKRPSERSRDRGEVLDDEIDVVQVPWLDLPLMCAKLRVDRQTASAHRSPCARTAATTSVARRESSGCKRAPNTAHDIARTVTQRLHPSLMGDADPMKNANFRCSGRAGATGIR